MDVPLLVFFFGSVRELAGGYGGYKWIHVRGPHDPSGLSNSAWFFKLSCRSCEVYKGQNLVTTLAQQSDNCTLLLPPILPANMRTAFTTLLAFAVSGAFAQEYFEWFSDYACQGCSSFIH